MILILPSDVVDYLNKAAVDGMTQVRYPTVGSMFVSVGATDTFKLGDITMTTKDQSGNRVDGGGYGANCTLMIIDPSTSRVDMDKRYLFYGYADGANVSDRGWYNSKDESTIVNNESFPAGQAFLCNFVPSMEVQLNFAGRVLTGDVTIDSVVDGVTYGFPYVVNPFPSDITLGDIEMKTVDVGGNLQDGGGYGANCTLMVIDPSTSRVDMDKRYLFYGYADGASHADRGWYNSNDEYTIVDDSVTVKAGDGFLCNFATSFKPKLIFKNPIK